MANQSPLAMPVLLYLAISRSRYILILISADLDQSLTCNCFSQYPQCVIEVDCVASYVDTRTYTALVI